MAYFPRKSCKLLHVSVAHSFLLLAVFHSMDVYVCLPTHPLKDTWANSSFWLLQTNHCDCPSTGFGAHISFPFLWDKCPRVRLLSHLENCMFSFMRNCQPLCLSSQQHFSASLPAFGGVTVIPFHQPGTCVVAVSSGCGII